MTDSISRQDAAKALIKIINKMNASGIEENFIGADGVEEALAAINALPAVDEWRDIESAPSELPVTQADRDAADAHFDIWYPDTAWGFDALAEAFARYRIVTIEECAKVAETIISADQYDTMDTDCYQDTADRIAAAIRALAAPTPPEQQGPR